jgi:hypothetical protein
MPPLPIISFAPDAASQRPTHFEKRNDAVAGHRTQHKGSIIMLGGRW